MKLFYITRVDIPSQSAQSIQISAMCDAFSKQLGNESFKLISTETDQNKNISKKYIWDKIRLNSKFRYLEFCIKSLKIVLSDIPSHIFTRDIVVAFIYSFFNIKVIYEAHKEPKTITAKLMGSYLKKRDNFLLICISDALKEYYINKCRLRREKTFSYHDGVFIEKYDLLRNKSKIQLREELNLPKDRILIIHTGSLYKGNDAKLFELVVKNFQDILFVQVGGTNADIDKYKKYYEEYNNIIFVHHQSNDILIKYQMSADILFYALTKKNILWWCTSPLKLFEYMATGIPILGSNIGSVSEILNNENSIPYNPDNENNIIKGVNLFLNDKGLCIQRSSEALRQVREKYTWDIRIKKILEFIN